MTANLVSGAPEAWAGGRLTIDLGALVDNWRRLGERSAPARAAAVVKADAYGTGLAEAVGALVRAGCGTFFTATLAEGVAARRQAPGADVYVLNGLPPRTADVFAAERLRPVLGSLDEFREWRAFCAATELRPAALHVDTGMNRLGLRPEEAAELGAGELAAAGIELLMSHLVSAEDPADPINARQIADFHALAHRFPGIPASLANSSGIFLGRQAQFDLVRPGYALYGGNPLPGRANPMRAVVRLEAPIVQLRRVPDGETVGYNGQWRARGDRRLAVIGVGYADGYLRSGSATDLRPGSVAIVAGRRCPFAGRVSMDLITVDVSGVPEGDLRRGDPVLLIGEGLGVDEVGAMLGTNGYEVLTGLSRRYARTHVGG
jgi:alanine racemase